MPRSETGFDLEVYAALLGATGAPAMGAMLLAAVNEILPVNEIYGFEIRADSPPNSIISVGADKDASSRVNAYATRYFSADPLRVSLRRTRAARTVQLRSISAAQILDPQYRFECYERPRFGGKSSIALEHDQGWLVLSLFRPRAQEGLSLRAEERLKRFGGFALPLLGKHSALCGGQTLHSASFAERVKNRLARAYPTLTRREREVCAHTLAGLTSEACGLELGISQSSVLTYRRRAYERLGISSVNQLLPALMP